MFRVIHFVFFALTNTIKIQLIKWTRYLTKYQHMKINIFLNTGNLKRFFIGCRRVSGHPEGTTIYRVSFLIMSEC